MIRRFIRERDGNTAVEYALVASLIAMAILLALNSLSSATENNFNQISSAVEGATQGGNT